MRLLNHRQAMASNLSLERLRATWAELGATDPLWAVVTKEDKRGGKWDSRDFLQTGERDVARYQDLLCRFAGCPQEFDHVLDFGCGVGRLSLAWSRRAKRVTGVDISPGMIAKGKDFAKETLNVELHLNEESDLRCFPAEQVRSGFLPHLSAAHPLAACRRTHGGIRPSLPLRRMDCLSVAIAESEKDLARRASQEDC
jgi:SAM-dependent methyltransferase